MYPPRTPADASIEFEQLNISGPDFGLNVIQFWADAVDASVFQFSKNPPRDYLSKKDHIHTQAQQAVIRLQDKRGRHCGLWFDIMDDLRDRLWQHFVKQMPELAGETQRPRELIAGARGRVESKAR
jgi:hypothetical protein